MFSYGKNLEGGKTKKIKQDRKEIFSYGKNLEVEKKNFSKKLLQQ